MSFGFVRCAARLLQAGAAPYAYNECDLFKYRISHRMPSCRRASNAFPALGVIFLAGVQTVTLPTPKWARVRSEVTEASKTVGERILGVLLVNRVGLCRHDEIVLVQIFDL